MEVPRSPCRARQATRELLDSRAGRSRRAPSAAASVRCEASGGSTETSGSPGARCTSMKHTTATPSMIGRRRRARLQMKISISLTSAGGRPAAPPSWSAAAEGATAGPVPPPCSRRRNRRRRVGEKPNPAPRYLSALLHAHRREVDEPALGLHDALDLRAHGARADVVGDPQERRLLDDAGVQLGRAPRRAPCRRRRCAPWRSARRTRRCRSSPSCSRPAGTSWSR